MSLDYNSTTADAQPIFLVHYQLPSTLPTTVTAQLTLDTNLVTTVSYNPSNLNPGDWVQIGLQSNATSLSTGRYPYQISIYNGSSTTTYSGNVDIVNEASSPYGAGWSLDNVEQLVPVSGGMMLVQPGGTSLFFANNGSGGYLTPAGDFSTLTTSSGAYTRTLPDGTKINFNSSGLQTSIVDRDSNTTTFSYNLSNLLTSITDRNGQQTTLAYNGSGKLTSITDPASRTATLAYSSSGNQLTSITDPASETWQYSYLSSGEMSKLTDPRNNATTFRYDFAKRVLSVAQADGTMLALVPEQVNGLAPSGSSNVRAALLAVGDQAQYTDARSNVWTTELDWSGFGRDIQNIDPLSDVSFTYRDTNGLPWMSSDALSSRTREFFNNQGNATMVVAPDDTTQKYGYNNFSEVTLYTDQLTNLTTYSYNSKGDLTQVTDPLNNVTTSAYNSAGLVTSTTDPNGHTSTSAYDSLNRLTKTTDALGDVSTMAYDNAGNLTSTTNARGFTTTFSYDLMGRKTGQTVQIGSGVYATTTFAYDKVGNLTSTTDPLNHTSTAAFDALNRQTAQTDPLGHQTTYGYDANGNETSVTDALHRMSTYAYDAANRQTSSTDPAGDQTTTAYDAAGEVTSTTDPMGNTTTTTYTPTGLVSTVTDPVGNVTAYDYDTAGYRTTQTVTPSSGRQLFVDSPEMQTWNNNANHQATAYTDAAGNQTTYAFDKDGNTTLATDALGHQTTYGYDALNRLTSVEDALTDTTTYGYDAVGNRTSVTDPLGRQTVSGFDGANRLTAVTDPRSGVTSYGYDLAGNQTSVTDSANNQTTYGYDAANRQTQMTDPLGHAQTYAYDAANQLTSTTDRDGRTINYGYDQAGRMTGETWVSGSYTATFSYNKDSLVTLAQDSNSEYTYGYNADKQLTSVSNAGTPGGMPTVSLSYGYDGFQNTTSLTDTINSNVGATVAYGYNMNNQLTSVAMSLGSTLDAQVTMGYDAANRLTGMTRTGASGSDTITSALSYDNANRLTNITHTDTTKPTTLANYTYGYDQGNQLTSYTDNSSSSLTYGYDPDGQLTSASGTLNGSSYSVSYSYDTNGNRTMTGYSTGKGNELLNDGTYSYTYDYNGNLTTQTTIATGSVTYYTWDYRNRLTEVKEETSSNGTVIYDEKFTYDVNNNRIGMLVNGTQTWTVFDGKNPYMDFSNGSNTPTQRYLVNPQSLNQFYGQVSGSGTTQWFLTDNIGSIRQVVSTSGSVLDKIIYDPFGSIVSQTNGANAPRFLYTGGAYDSNTGSYLDGAREENPAAGRWLSQDPLGLRPDSNPYRYVYNKPTYAVDPTGLAGIIGVPQGAPLPADLPPGVHVAPLPALHADPCDIQYNITMQEIEDAFWACLASGVNRLICNLQKIRASQDALSEWLRCKQAPPDTNTRPVPFPIPVPIGDVEPVRPVPAPVPSYSFPTFLFLLLPTPLWPGTMAGPNEMT